MSNPIQVRSPEEIQRAHDVLVGVNNPSKEAPGSVTVTVLDAVASALCWVLQHDHNDKVSILLQLAEAMMRAEGLELVDSGKPPERDV